MLHPSQTFHLVHQFSQFYFLYNTPLQYIFCYFSIYVFKEDISRLCIYKMHFLFFLSLQFLIWNLAPLRLKVESDCWTYGSLSSCCHNNELLYGLDRWEFWERRDLLLFTILMLGIGVLQQLLSRSLSIQLYGPMLNLRKQLALCQIQKIYHPTFDLNHVHTKLLFYRKATPRLFLIKILIH